MTPDAVEEALLTRRSVRGFLPREVPRALVERLLMLAARAPSSTNVQPSRGCRAVRKEIDAVPDRAYEFTKQASCPQQQDVSVPGDEKRVNILYRACLPC